jgi:hypothetical protein
MPHYKFNQNYFDNIDTENKAYWLGFLWCDGYIAKRERVDKYGIRIEYNIKLSLQENDKEHLIKFVSDIEGNYPVHRYAMPKNNVFSNGKELFESRVFITNLHMGKTLQEKYGIIPNRSDCSKILNFLPEELYKHFIRGILDGDGTISFYVNTDKQGGKTNKANLSFTTYESILEFIERYFYKIGLTETEYYKKYKRHKEEGKDGYCRTLSYSGIPQVTKLVNYLYEDANIYLDRKFEKYLNRFSNKEKELINEI